jgi:anti-sigma regulatory factor (Ser/Thr protein kinase)
VYWCFRSEVASRALAVRRRFIAFLRERCAPQSDYGAAEIIFSELVSNVIRHANGPIEIIARQEPEGTIILEVRDRGTRFPHPAGLPPITEERGRGLYIVSELSVRFTIEHADEGNRVIAVLPLDCLGPKHTARP